MRIFSEKEQKSKELTEVVCNQCGKKLLVEGGIVKEGCFHVEHEFDFFSHKDGEVYHIDLCEACFDRWTAEFLEPAQVTETKEYL